jgi:hypothetical protein
MIAEMEAGRLPRPGSADRCGAYRVFCANRQILDLAGATANAWLSRTRRRPRVERAAAMPLELQPFRSGAVAIVIVVEDEDEDDA